MELVAASTLVALSVGISVLLGRAGIKATFALIERRGDLNR